MNVISINLYKGVDVMPKKRVFTIKEAAELIEGITVFRIRQMCISGQLPCFMAGHKYLISEDALYKAVFGECEKNISDNENCKNNK